MKTKDIPFRVTKQQEKEQQRRLIQRMAEEWARADHNPSTYQQEFERAKARRKAGLPKEPPTLEAYARVAIVRCKTLKDFNSIFLYISRMLPYLHELDPKLREEIARQLESRVRNVSERGATYIQLLRRKEDIEISPALPKRKLLGGAK